MNKIAAVRYDGSSSKPTSVTLTFLSDGSVLIDGDGLSVNYPKDEVTIPSQVGGVHARVQFSDNSLCEISDYRALQSVLPDVHKGGMLNRWERSTKVVLIALIATIAFVWGSIEFVLPVAAKNVANNIPLAWETAMGEQTLAGFEKIGLFSPSSLSEQRQQALTEKFKLALRRAEADPVPQVLFRASKTLEANALALPSGIIVFTDEMVNFAEDDRELIGILGHEFGHVKNRHTMRHVLQNSVIALALIMITGDVGSLSALATTMPVILAQAKYSRGFETEADNYAITFLQQQNIDPRYLANMLERLGEKYGDTETTGYLDSHPATSERLQNLTGD